MWQKCVQFSVSVLIFSFVPFGWKEWFYYREYFINVRVWESKKREREREIQSMRFSMDVSDILPACISKHACMILLRRRQVCEQRSYELRIFWKTGLHTHAAHNPNNAREQIELIWIWILCFTDTDVHTCKRTPSGAGSNRCRIGLKLSQEFFPGDHN